VGVGAEVMTVRTVCPIETRAQAVLLTLRAVGLSMVGLMILFYFSMGCGLFHLGEEGLMDLYLY
jgi:hypothetical protein